MKTALFVSAAVLTAGIAISTSASAATCTYINDGDQGDAFFMSQGVRPWNCGQVFIDDMWNRFDFDSGDWDDGFGYEAPCDNARPLARTFNALYALGYSHTGSPNCSNSGILLDWAYCWAGNQIDELDGRCGSGTSGPFGLQALTRSGPVVDNWTELYWPFFYGTTVVERAATIFHEARHANGCGHNFQTTKDVAWSQGCEFQWSGNGAWAYTVLFLWWYNANADMATPTLKERARDRANTILPNQFQVDPCFRINSDGSSFTVC